MIPAIGAFNRTRFLNSRNLTNSFILKQYINPSCFQRNTFHSIRFLRQSEATNTVPSPPKILKAEGPVELVLRERKEAKVKEAAATASESESSNQQPSQISTQLKDNTISTNSTSSAVTSPSEPKKSFIDRAIHEFQHYWSGFKLLGAEAKISARLLIKLLNGKKLTRREQRQLRRTTGDLIRIVPLIIIVAIPFLEFALPFLLYLFPNMLPSTFESKYQKEEKRKKLLKVRFEMAKFLQETVEEVSVSGAGMTAAKEFSNFFHT
ncbi:hypothetical protein HK096_011093, partial [Nowakowskiella sp. JEL0078]